MKHEVIFRKYVGLWQQTTMEVEAESEDDAKAKAVNLINSLGGIYDSMRFENMDDTLEDNG